MKYSLLQLLKQHAVPNLATLVAVALMLSFGLTMQTIAKQAIPLSYYLTDQQAIPQTQIGGGMARSVNYQGCLMNQNGSPLNETVKLTLALYAMPTGGVALWQETHTQIKIDNCYFNLLAGSKTAIPNSVWHTKPLYLGVKVNDDAEMTPREQLAEAAPTLCTGQTNPDRTGWVNYNINGKVVGVYIDVDTSSCGFGSTPMYFSSLNGTAEHWEVIGSNAIYGPTATGFRIYIQRRSTINANVANQHNWHIQWMAVLP